VNIQVDNSNYDISKHKQNNRILEDKLRMTQ